MIITDGWGAYNDLEKIDGDIYSHEIINHKFEFVSSNDPMIHTENIENLWMRLKRKLKYQFGTKKEHFPLYIGDFMWRQYFQRQSLFQSFILTISDQFNIKNKS